MDVADEVVEWLLVPSEQAGDDADRLLRFLDSRAQSFHDCDEVDA